jgi:Ca2+-binding EF-hand superfamily protein
MARCIPLSLVFAILFSVGTQAGETPAATTDAKSKPKSTVSDAPVTVTQLQDLNQASRAQLDAVKKYAEARRNAQQASQSLVRIANAIAAKGGLASEADLKQVDEAKSKLEAAIKSSAKLREEARKAQVAAQAAAARATTRGAVSNPSMRVRQKVDVTDPVERFLLLLPGGPLVVQVALTVDGKPFRTAREALIDEMLAAVDTDKGGKATWQEAFRSPAFTLGRIQIVNDQQVRQYLSIFDQNKNELVDRNEVRAFLARYFQGGAFHLASTSSRGAYGRVTVASNGRVSAGVPQANVQLLLDTNSDGNLSKEEIASAADRLKSRDANDDDLLLAAEVAGSSSRTGRPQRTTTGGAQRPTAQSQSLAILLGPTATSAELFAALTQRYRNEKGLVVATSFAEVPGLFAALDADKNGMLQQEETLTLNTMEPHVELDVNVGGGEETAGLKVGRLASGFEPSSETKNSFALALSGVNLSFIANTDAGRTIDYSRMATSYLTRYDGDKNGYIDEKELGTNFARMAQMWDVDRDKKIFAKEIEATYRRSQAPLVSQVRASLVNEGNPLFKTLDASGDGRLSLREMRTAPKRILTFDENKDGQISADEVPTTISVTFARGNAGYNYGRVVRNGSAAPARSTPKDQPEWFTRMDRNGDGDVTLKEFPGEKPDFEKLDTNNDGFIEPAEAKAAKADSAE